MDCPYCDGTLKLWKIVFGRTIYKCDKCNREVEF